MPPVVEKGLLGLSVALAALYLLVAGNILIGDDFESMGRRAGWVAASALSGLLIVAGLWLGRRAPIAAGVLVVVGAAPLGYALVGEAWAVFPVAQVVAVYGVLRALDFARERRHVGR